MFKVLCGNVNKVWSRPRSRLQHNGHNGELIGNYHRSFEWYNRFPPTTSSFHKMGVLMHTRVVAFRQIILWPLLLQLIKSTVQVSNRCVLWIGVHFARRLFQHALTSLVNRTCNQSVAGWYWTSGSASWGANPMEYTFRQVDDSVNWLSGISHPSFCLSVTLRYCVKTAKHIVDVILPPYSHTILVFSQLVGIT